MANPQTVVAARLVCYVNGVRYGKVTGFHYSSETSHKEARGIDSLVPYELMPTSVRVTGSMSVVRTTADGGLEGAGLTAPIPDIPRERYFSLTVLDRMTDTVVFRADQCKVTSQSWAVEARSPVSGQFTFQAIIFNNEVGASTP